GAHHVCAELVDRLGCEAEVSHHGNARRQNSLDTVQYEFAAFHLDAVRSGFLHDAHGALQGEPAVALVRAEGHVDDDQRPPDAAHDGGRVIDHLIERDRQGRLVTMNDVGGAVAHQHHV